MREARAGTGYLDANVVEVDRRVNRPAAVDAAPTAAAGSQARPDTTPPVER